jgi:cyclopropane-fatty-acyl-phospholipid synthase
LSEDPSRSSGQEILDRIQFEAQRRAARAQRILPVVRRLLGIERRGGGELSIHPLGSHTISRVREHEKDAFARSVSGGSACLLNAFIKGGWSSPDLVATLQSLHDFDRVLQRSYKLFDPIAPLVMRIRERREPASNIHETSLHYDLDPEFFSRSLGDSMIYSALRGRPEDWRQIYRETLATLTNATGTTHPKVLDLGCGWGAFGESALQFGAQSYCGVTASRVQAEYARGRLPNSADIRVADIHDSKSWGVDADIVVLLESIEHTSPGGQVRLFHELIARFPGAAVLVQATCLPPGAPRIREGRRTITNSVIFPGPGGLVSIGYYIRSLTQAGYKVDQVIDLSGDYFSGMRQWFDNLSATIGSAPSDLEKLWLFYLAGITAANSQRNTSAYQILAVP